MTVYKYKRMDQEIAQSDPTGVLEKLSLDGWQVKCFMNISSIFNEQYDKAMVVEWCYPR